MAYQTYYKHHKPLDVIAKLFLLVVVLGPVLYGSAAKASTGYIPSPRVLSISSSVPGDYPGGAGIVTHTFTFTLPSAATVRSIKFEYCDSANPHVACNAPANYNNTSAVLGSTSGLVGFSLTKPDTKTFLLVNAGGQAMSANTPVVVPFNNVTNPGTYPTNTAVTFYVRITSYTDAGGTAGNEIDQGNVASSTAVPLTFTGITPESMIFCVGITVGPNGDCTSMSGSSIDFGLFNPEGTKTGTSVFNVSTNAVAGYNVSVVGTTLRSGLNSIPNNASTAPAKTHEDHFGFNLKANSGIFDYGAGPTAYNASPGPSFGGNPTGTGVGNIAAGYNSPDQFKFNSGDQVAYASSGSDANIFTESYIVNIADSQPVGVYTTTITYICTAAF